MFVYRHFQKWGFGVGLPAFLLVVLPLWLIFEIVKVAVLTVRLILIGVWRATKWAWRWWHKPPAPSGDRP